MAADGALVLRLLRGDPAPREVLAGRGRALLALAVANDVPLPVAEALARSPGAAGIPPGVLEAHRRRFEGFWSTVALVRDLLGDRGLDPLFIKTYRLHPYYDGNLDILVPPPLGGTVDRALVPAGFRRATRRTDLGKFLLEPDKAWYHAPPPFTPVHVYPTVSWHGMEFLPAARVLEAAVERRFAGRRFLAPAWTDDLLIHCAHTVFENYELKLGELFHVASVALGEGVDPVAMAAVARAHGWSRALDLALGTVKGLWAALLVGESLDLPLGRQRAVHPAAGLPWPYPREELVKAWLQRSGFHARRGRLRFALRELWRHPAYRFYKRVVASAAPED